MSITPLFQGWVKSVAALGCVALLAACGGGSGKSSTAASLSSASSLSSSSSLSTSSSLSSASKVSSVSSLSSASSSVAPDTTPDAFGFTPVTNAALNVSITSNAITISGINTATPISITGGQYAINGGTPTSAAGTITNGQTVTVTLTTAGTVSTNTQAVLTVGGVAATFTVTTTNIAGVVTTFAGTSPGADGIGLAARFNAPNGVVSDGTNLYVADTENNKIRKIVITTGVVTTLAGSGSYGSADGTGTAASLKYPRGITSDGTNLYVADTDNHTIRKIVIATGAVTTLAGSGSSGSTDGTGTAASFNYPSGITSDGTNLYVADSGNDKIRKIVIATGEVTTLAGSGSEGSADGTGTAASFYSPNGITSDGTNLYVADSGNNKIRKIVIATGAVTTLAGSGLSGSADGTGAAASFSSPIGITSDGTNLFMADTYNNKIRKIVITTGVVTTLAGSSSEGGADGTGTAASFHYPDGITSDGINLYVVDTYNHNIRKIVIATGEVTTLAGSGSSEGSADGTGTAANFNDPVGITSDGTNLYVAENYNHKIRKIVIATGVVTTLAGSGSVGSADGTGTAASFSYPNGITSDDTNLYVVDSSNHKVRKIVIATGAVTTLAGSGLSGSADGTGTAASFQYPQGITSDGTHLYVADSNNHKVRKIVIATGEVTTLAGSGLSGSADGTGTAASLEYPRGITSDGTNLYVADSSNNKIRKIVIATGVVTTLAGSGSSRSADGTGTAASFNYPYGITSDGTNLYVMEPYNNTVRKIVIATGVVTTLAGGTQGSADGVGTAASFNEPYGITSDGFSLFVTDTKNNTIRKIH